jgi:hypothetical protein
MLKTYAIRHIPSGKWMPARLNSSSGGWSHWEPTTDEKPYDSLPRLFATLRSAQNALSAWLNGKHYRRQGTYYDWEGIPDSYDELTVEAPEVSRVRSEMEIVPMLLKEDI